uniref:EF-hand domain-containing protein n=1 Tax=Macrostomum lignano TaxID=282301 RepID=A0A1I8GWD0_9PLAT
VVEVSVVPQHAVQVGVALLPHQEAVVIVTVLAAEHRLFQVAVAALVLDCLRSRFAAVRLVSDSRAQGGRGGSGQRQEGAEHQAASLFVHRSFYNLSKYGEPRADPLAKCRASIYYPVEAGRGARQEMEKKNMQGPLSGENEACVCQVDSGCWGGNFFIHSLPRKDRAGAELDNESLVDKGDKWGQIGQMGGSTSSSSSFAKQPHQLSSWRAGTVRSQSAMLKPTCRSLLLLLPLVLAAAAAPSKSVAEAEAALAPESMPEAAEDEAGAAADEAFAAPTLDDEDRRISQQEWEQLLRRLLQQHLARKRHSGTMSMKQIQNLYQMMKNPPEMAVPATPRQEPRLPKVHFQEVAGATEADNLSGRSLVLEPVLVAGSGALQRLRASLLLQPRGRPPRGRLRPETGGRHCLRAEAAAGRKAVRRKALTVAGALGHVTPVAADSAGAIKSRLTAVLGRGRDGGWQRPKRDSLAVGVQEANGLCHGQSVVSGQLLASRVGRLPGVRCRLRPVVGVAAGVTAAAPVGQHLVGVLVLTECVTWGVRLRGALEKVPEDQGVLEKFPEDQGAIEKVPEDSEALKKVPEDLGALEEVPEDLGALEEVPEDTGALEEVPEDQRRLHTAHGLQSFSVPENLHPVRLEIPSYNPSLTDAGI